MDDPGEPNVSEGAGRLESEKGDVMTEAKVWSDVRKGSQAKECRWPLKAKKARKMVPLRPPEGISPGNTLT